MIGFTDIGLEQLMLAEVSTINEFIIFSALLVSATVIFLTSKFWEEACTWL